MAQSSVEILERIKASVSAQFTGMRSVTVPLQGQEPLTIYFRPRTLRDKGRTLKLMERDPAEALVESLIVRALDADGTRMFTLGMKGEFLNTPGMYAFVEAAMNMIGAVDKEEDEAEGASQGS